MDVPTLYDVTVHYVTGITGTWRGLTYAAARERFDLARRDTDDRNERALAVEVRKQTEARVLYRWHRGSHR
jgi:hypothetical protein